MKKLCGGLVIGLALTWTAPARAQETLTVSYAADAKPTLECADQPKVKFNGTLKWSPGDSSLVIVSPRGEVSGTVNPDGSAKLRGPGGEYDIPNIFGNTGVNFLAAFDDCFYLATFFLDRVIPSPWAEKSPKEEPQRESGDSGSFPLWLVVGVASAVTLLASIVYKSKRPESTVSLDHPGEHGAKEPQQSG